MPPFADANALPLLKAFNVPFIARFDVNDWIAPVMFIAGGVVVGYIVERLSFNLIRKITRRIPGLSEDSLVNPLSGIMFWFFVLNGFLLASYCMDAVKDSVLFAMRKVIFVAAMLLTIRYISNVAVSVVTFYVGRNNHARLPSTSIFVNLARIVIFGIGVLVLLQSLGISVMPIITALGVGGLAVSLALQDTMANFFAGIHILVARQIKIGDYVRLEGGQEGFVSDIGWRNTTLKQISNNLILVPNTKMASNILTDYAMPLPDMMIKIEGAVTYQSDLKRTEAIIKEVGGQTMSETKKQLPTLESNGDVLVRFHTFGDSGILFTAILQVKNLTDSGFVKHEFMKRLHERFAQEGIEFPSPRQVLRMERFPVLEMKSLPGGGNHGQRDHNGTSLPVGSAADGKESHN